MKLSVMMITYNHEQFIAQALESILAQQVNFDYEIVVGEDRSTDRTREILLAFCNRYPGRIVPLLPDQNLGMMRNLEQTLLACRGEYIAIIEGDDYWTCADKLQKQVDFLDHHPDYSLCCHRARVMAEDGFQPAGIGLPTSETGIFPTRESGRYGIEDLLTENFIMSCTTVYRREAFGSVPDWFRNLGLGDWAAFVLIARSGAIHLMDDVMATYRVHVGGVWSSQDWYSRTKKTMELLKTLDGHLGYKYHSRIRRTIAYIYLYQAICFRNDGRIAEARELLFESIRNGGWKLPNFRQAFRPIVLGSWYGMSITTQLVQSLLGKFGYKLVRVKTNTDQPASTPISPVSPGRWDGFFTLLKRLNFSPKHVLDIGAHKGDWTRNAVRFFPDCQYTLVEPQEKLKIDIQDLLDAGYKITWITAGASDTSGILPFNIAYREDSCTFKSDLPGIAATGAPQIMVPVKTLNEIVSSSDSPMPDMVKIDAEGFDLKVLAGASDLIGKTELFFVEVSVCCLAFEDNTIARVVQRMDELGYRVIDITDINRSKKYGLLWLSELVFLRKDSHLLDGATSYE